MELQFATARRNISEDRQSVDDHGHSAWSRPQMIENVDRAIRFSHSHVNAGESVSGSYHSAFTWPPLLVGAVS
jgi:hypothetical protein